MAGEDTNRGRRRLAAVRTLLILGGAGLAAVAVLAGPLGISHSRGLSQGKLVVAGVGCALLLGGVLWRRTWAAYRATATILLNTVVLVFVIEGGLFFSNWISGHLGSKAPEAVPSPSEWSHIRDGPEALRYYAERDWGATYFREYSQVWGTQGRSQRYVPFVVWRCPEFHGQTINVDADGIRLTPGAECDPGSYQVYVFGGSTMWGTGVPDWGTIPAFLQERLAAEIRGPVCVVNYGEIGWVSSQSVIQLALALRDGRTPDLALFYNGVNDVNAGYQTGVAGVHLNFEPIAARFERRDQQAKSPVVSCLETLRLFKRISRASSRPMHTGGNPFGAEYTLESLADEVVEDYLRNYELVEALAAAYGFDFASFWQPVLSMDGKTLKPEEKSMREGDNAVYPGLAQLYDATYARIDTAAQQRSRLFNLANVFAGSEELVYVDPIHLTAEGNRAVADVIVDHLRQGGLGSEARGSSP